MTSEEIELFLTYTVDITQSFLENDMKIKVGEISICENDIRDKYAGLISFDGRINFFCLIAIEGELLEKIFQVMLPFEMSTEEKEEMMKLLPNEVVNIIAGLTILKFPKEYSDEVMSVPLVLKEKILEIFKINNLSASKKLAANFGDFICTVINRD